MHVVIKSYALYSFNNNNIIKNIESDLIQYFFIGINFACKYIKQISGGNL